LNKVIPDNKIQELTEKHGLEYFELTCTNEKKFIETFERILEVLMKLIPTLPKPEQLMKKNIIIGKKLLQSSKYQLVD